jgi:hypothetical protein
VCVVKQHKTIINKIIHNTKKGKNHAQNRSVTKQQQATTTTMTTRTKTCIMLEFTHQDLVTVNSRYFTTAYLINNSGMHKMLDIYAPQTQPHNSMVGHYFQHMHAASR